MILVLFYDFMVKVAVLFHILNVFNPRKMKIKWFLPLNITYMLINSLSFKYYFIPHIYRSLLLFKIKLPLLCIALL